ncbi:glycosyltransferase family 4 protein [Niallia taxi]|uniref:glycosyltransferase family 4 protein n=1 Tax=Niallia taxi TaxID=2499688 RepID=UPI0030096ACF
MKTLIISSMYPYPKDNGKSIIISSILEYLISQFGSENVDYMLIGNEGEVAEKENQQNIEIFQLEKPKFITQLKNLFLYSAIKRDKSIQESMLYSKKIKGQMNEIIKSKEYELIIYDTIRIAQYFEKEHSPNAKEIVYLDDLFSERYKKMLEVLKNNKEVELNPLGNFSKFLPSFSQSLINFRLINQMLLSYEKNLVKKRENVIANSFTSLLLISEKEVNLLSKRTNSENIRSINPVLKEHSSYTRIPSDKKRFLFLGSLNIPHNEASILNFIEVNKEFLKNNATKVHIDIVGKNASTKLKELVKTFSNITIHGFIEDLDELMDLSAAMIVPLIFGSGVKLKTLDAFSKGLPVITTDFGIEGINVIPDVDCIVENDIGNFPERMLEILNRDYNKRISTQSYDFFVRNYSKENVYKEYSTIFKK